MKVFTEKSRSWRRMRNRGVSPIIATILLVAITVVLAAVLYILISGLTKGPGNTPIGTSLALNKPNEASKGATNWYNFSVASAGGGLLLNNLVFQVQGPGGTIVVTTAAGWTLNVLGLTGSTIGTYAITSATPSWTLGGTTPVSSSQTIVLTSPAATLLNGDTLVVVGAGSFSGSISVSIP